MRKVGLIGGTHRDTMSYFALINGHIARRLGGHHTASLSIEQPDLFEYVQSDWDKIERIVSDAAISLEKSGVDAIAICSSTLHKVADAVSQKISLPLLDMRDAIATAFKIQRYEGLRFLLLGTMPITDSEFVNPLTQAGVALVVPILEDRADIVKLLDRELTRGAITSKSAALLGQIVHDYCKSHELSGTLMGCSELTVLTKHPDFLFQLRDNSPVNLTLLDAVKIHSHHIAEYMLAS